MKKQTKRLHGIRVRDRVLTKAFVLFIGLIMVSCSKKDYSSQGIRIIVEDIELEDGTTVQIPSFDTDNEQIKKNLRELERQKRNLQKTVEREQKKKNHLEMKCHVSEVKNYPQVTVVWKTEEKKTVLNNILTLAADEKEGMPITCKEALDNTGMSGVELSLKVGRLAKEKFAKENIAGEISSTEMQGFVIDEEGRISEIYMKLTLEVEKNEDNKREEHFFSYIPGDEKLVKLSEKGFDVP